jgi:hypothetical protein
MMNCETFREQLNADPIRENDEFDRHAETCDACQAYRARLMRTEMLIQKALRFPVNAVAEQSARAPVRRSRVTGWLRLASGVAAVLVVSATFWVLRGPGPELTPEALAFEVANHWYHEPESWVEGEAQVDLAQLARVLDGTAQINLSELRTVSYAESCLVAGEWIPHLVIQGEQGPYMVLLMPDRTLASPVPLELPDEGLSGRIVPAGAGSIAVFGGGPTAETDQLEASILSAVNWTI